MPLTTGSRIGPYEITSLIGAGGMGEVFRAIDVNLGRSAAIKVLPAAVANDADRLVRFEREAQTLASLNHPNIAQVFGFEKGDAGFRALAMEFVDGPTLADRINGAPMPVDDVIAIAVQIADALESAHDHGIIHRDLKPLNVKVRPDGMVKVLDFGLAKAVTGSAGADASMSMSPTVTTPAMTNAGVVLGTAAYMSPEQAKGRVVDRRADIWAFGCVLFEMLTGSRAFRGADVSDVFVSVLRDDPDWSLLPATTPAHLRSLLRRCLQKDPRKRLPHIGVARLELAEPATSAGETTAIRRSRGWWRPAAAAAALMALGVPGWFLWTRRSIEPAPVTHLRFDVGLSGERMAGAVAISPDGRSLAFIARPSSEERRSMLFVRHLDRLDAQMLSGTDGADAPMFSPDGRSVAFFSDNALKKVSIDGGTVVTLCAVSTHRGGWWGPGDVIIFASAEGLHQIPAGGGTPVVFAQSTPSQPPPETPQVLPGKRGVIYTQAVSSDPNIGTISVLGFDGGPPKEVLQPGRFPRYVDSGHLTFVRGGTLYAVPFDLDALSATGDAVPIVEGVFQVAFNGFPNLAISKNGQLVYQAGNSALARQGAIMWLTQTDGLAPLRSAPAAFGFPRFSPDGRRLAMVITTGRQADIWVYEWERDILTRVTTDPATDLAPVWTPDGTGLVFASNRESNLLNLYWQRADGTGGAERLTNSNAPQIPGGFDPDGRRLVYHEGDPATGRQAINLLPIERVDGVALKAGTPSVLVGGALLKSYPRISPDGRWIAYAAGDAGTFEIYVQSFPAMGERVQVSNGGGALPIWSPTKPELYYSDGGRRMMAVQYRVVDNAFAPAKPREWSQTLFSAIPPLNRYGPGYDIHPDGTRFAVSAPQNDGDQGAGAESLMLVQNFFDELRRRARFR